MRNRSSYSYRSPGSGPYRSPFASHRMTSESEKAAQAEAARLCLIEREKIERFDPSDFTETELIALMSASESDRHQAIFHGLRYRDKLQPIPFPVLMGLKVRDLIEKPEGRRFYLLTDAGRAIADKVADHIVKTKDFHTGYGYHAKTDRYEGSAKCVCGWMQRVSSFNFQSNANRAFGNHMRQVEAAKVKAG